MKNQHTTDRKFGGFIIGIFTLLWIFLTLVLIETAYPDIKYRIVISGIVIGFIALIFLLCIIYLCRKAPLSKFHLFHNKSKVVYSVLYLFLTVGFLWCIEYLFYQKNKDLFSIDQEYLDKSTLNRTMKIQAELEIYQHFRSTYEKLASTTLPTKNYNYLKTNNKIYSIIEGDTLFIHLNRTLTSPSIHSINHRKDTIDYYGVSSIGISTSNEPHTQMLPSSRKVLEHMKQNGNIHGSDLIELMNQKAQLYNQRCIRHEVMILSNTQTISFPAFITYNLFNYSSIAKVTNIIIRTLILLQTILITFISGYIYKTLYSILDKK